MTSSYGWVRTSINFDLPGKTFTVGARRLMVLGLNPPDYKKENDSPEEMIRWALRVLGHFRPELDSPRTIVAGVSCQLGSFEWEIAVFHPSLERVSPFSQWPRERLERCYVCHKPLGEWLGLLGIVENGKIVREETVCSKECLQADSRAADTPTTYNATTLPKSEWIK